MRLSYVHRGEVITLETEQQSGVLRVRLPDSSEHEVRARMVEEGVVEIDHEAHIHRIPFARTSGGIQFSFKGNVHEFTPHTPGRKIEKAQQSGALVAPMSGAVADVLVKVGEVVGAYQPLVVIEAMKVLATVESHHAGTVSRLHVAKGERVDAGAVLVEITTSP